MGTDIHLFVETRNHETGAWELATGAPAFFDRDYDAFAILAGVRNGKGFAGCDMGDGFVPIAEPRGLPNDMSQRLLEKRYDLGEHSFSWLTLDELLRYNWNQRTSLRGTVGPKEFVSFQVNGAPYRYSGGVSGPSVRHVSNEEMARLVAVGLEEEDDAGPGGVFNKWHVYTRIQWSVSYKEAAQDLHSRFIPELTDFARRNRLETTDVRIVFGFDS